MHAELESLKRVDGEQLVDTCELLQSNLATIAAATRLGSSADEHHQVFDLHMVAKTAVAKFAAAAGLE